MKTMKAGIPLVLVIAAAAFADNADSVFSLLTLNYADKLDAATVTKECAKTTQADPILIKDTDKGIFTDNQKVKCYYACLSVNFGTMDTHGNFNLPRIVNVTTELTESYIKACINNASHANPCERAYDTYKCFRIKMLKQKQ